MDVCMVSKHFHPYSGGLEVRVLELSKWLVGRGERVLVLSALEPGAPPLQDMGGVRVRRSRALLNLFNAPFIPGIMLDLLSQDYDVIDVNLPDPIDSVWALLGSLLRGKPLFVTYHADIIREGLVYLPFKLLYGPIQSLVLSRARRIFVTSPDYARGSKALCAFMDKVEVAPSFVDPAKYNPQVDGSKLKAEHAGRKIVLFVGRLVPYKGVKHLIEAAREISDADVVIVGDGPLRAELESQAKDLGNVFFAGQVADPELAGYYGACDVLVLPSVTRQEAFGLVLVEAMSCGKPVVSSDFSGMPFVVGDGGLLVPSGDSKALSRAISGILADPVFAAELGEKARARASELFTRDVVCSKLRDIYKSAVLRD
jgi:glycosyltransferase involved in cell wall biosynthesis